MDGANVNGGNAASSRDDSNLEGGDDGGTTNSGSGGGATVIETRNSSDKGLPTTGGNTTTMDAQEVNGELKSTLRKYGTSLPRRRIRKFKANSMGMMELETEAPGTRGRKRKLSEYDEATSEDSEEFNGFDSKGLELQPGSHVLRKLIAEAEIAEAHHAKRIKYSTRSFNAKEKIDDNQDFDDMRTYVYETDSFENLDMAKIKREKESDKSETDSIDIPNSIDSEIEPNKIDITFIRSANSSSAASSPSAMSQRSKGSQVSGGGSPGGKQKTPVDMSNPLYKEPFKYGWKRELVFRASQEFTYKKMADIYYYTPKGKKVRSFREVAESLNSKELTIDNFTFFKEPIGLNDPEQEIIRDAKRMRGSAGKKYKKAVAIRKTLSEPVTKKPEPVTRKSLYEPSTSKKQPVQEPPVSTPAPVPAETSKPVPAPVSVPIKAAKSAKAAVPPAYKTKTTKKTPQIKIKSPEENEMLPPQRSTPNTRRNQQPVEKVIPVKTKRSLTKKQNQKESDPKDSRPSYMNSVCSGYHALLRVFQYLKVQELLRAARVCKMWHDLAAHPSLWKTVRMKNSQVTDWDGLADTLQRRGTQHLDLRKMLVNMPVESDIWKKFLTVIPRVTSLVKLELCRCPVVVVEEVIKSCPQLEILSAMSIKCDSLTLESIGNLSRCQELRLKAITGMSLQHDLTPLQDLKHLTQLSLTSVKELGKKKIDVVQALTNLETLELGECSDFPDKFGTTVLINLNKLERLRLEKGQGSCCTFDILEGVSKLESLSQMELVNFDVKNGFDKCLANCKNIKRLLIIPTYISQSATSNNMVLAGVTELSDNLTHFIWGVTLELLRVTELFVDQCNLMSKQVTGDSIPVLKPVPCLRLIEDVEDENENQKGDDKQQPHLTSPQVDILPLPQLQKLLLTALPKTRVKILKIPFHATWRQSISDTTTQ